MTACMEWELVGVPYTSMSAPGGIAAAIGVLRGAGLAGRLAERGVRDGGDIELQAPTGERGPSGILNEPNLAELVAKTRERTAAILGRGAAPLLVGGDCPVLLGPLAALRDAGERAGLVMLDGHEDAWPPERSPTGEGSDSEIAIALGRVSGLPSPLGPSSRLLEERRLTQLGPRDAGEIAAAGLPSLRDRIASFADADAVRADPEAAMRGALARLDATAFWLHIDLDVLSTATFPAVDYRQPGGLGWSELDRLAAVAVADPRCRGASVVIYNPDLDPGRAGARAMVGFTDRLVAAA